MIERRAVDRRQAQRNTPNRRVSERRALDRWHATEPLIASFEIGSTRHIGLLRNVSTSGCMLEATMSVTIAQEDTDEIAEPTIGVVDLTLGEKTVRLEARIARDGKHCLGLAFQKPAGDALLAEVVDACKAYSIQYKDGKVCFVGDLSTMSAVLHLLKYVKLGATVDLSRARGDPTRAAASMTLLRERGVQLRGCDKYLNVAVALAEQRICPGCFSDCEQSQRYNGPDAKPAVLP